jgi:DNA polymerase-3 subunit delta'
MELTALYPWQQNLWQQFAAMQNNQRMPHALLLSGIKGLGKQTFADRMITSLLCQHRSANSDACGQCHSCQLLGAGSHPDHTVVSPEESGKQIKIDQIRQLKQKQTLMSKVSTWKTVLITHADSMNVNAFNSLLKLLEEPQPNSVLILISENTHQLPVTIKSRCQSLIMQVPDQQTSLSWLQSQNPQREIHEWQALLRLVQGAPLAAIAIQEQGLAQSQQIYNDFAALMKTQVNPVSMAASWQQYDLIAVMYQIQHLIQLKMESLLTGQEPVSPAILKQYWAISDCIIDTIKLISSQNNLNKTLLIEDFMVSVMQYANQIQRIRKASR